jgi:surface protein
VAATIQKIKGCSSLESLDLFSLYTDYIQNMNMMFSECSSLKYLNVSSLNTSSAITMEGMFSNCSSLQYLNLSSFNTSSVTNMNNMFKGCYSLEKLNLSNLFSMESVTSSDNMFSVPFIEITGENIEKINNQINSFQNFIKLKIFSENSNDLQFIKSNEVSESYINGIQNENDNKNTIENVEQNKDYNIILIFPNDEQGSCDGMFKDIKEIKSIEFYNFKFCNSSREMFSGCSSLETLNLESFDTTEITDMYRMFSGCSNLKTLGVLTLNTKNSQNVDNMFCNCDKLTEIERESFNENSFTCVEQCKEETPYLIEAENICVENCQNTDYKYTYTLENENKICASICPDSLLSFNFNCYSECPSNTKKNENENSCECQYKFYIDENNFINCLQENQNCEDTNYKLSINNKNQCYKDCPDNYINKNDNNICVCKYKYYYNNDELVCLGEKEECIDDFPYLDSKTNECTKTKPIEETEDSSDSDDKADTGDGSGSSGKIDTGDGSGSSDKTDPEKQKIDEPESKPEENQNTDNTEPDTNNSNSLKNNLLFLLICLFL